jgi:hypothetical protein
MIQKLAALYFSEFDPQYAMLDRDVFERQLGVWYATPVGVGVGSTLGQGMGQMRGLAGEAEMRACPAVVFQVCAVALVIVEDDDGGVGVGDGNGSEGRREDGFQREDFEGLKYAGGMTFEDLAREYADLGVEVLAVLGKRGMGLNTVTAGWLRSSWLKYVGWVTESVGFCLSLSVLGEEGDQLWGIVG